MISIMTTTTFWSRISRLNKPGDDAFEKLGRGGNKTGHPDLQRNLNFSDSAGTDAQALDGALCCTDLFDTHPTLPLRSPSLFLMGLERRLPASRDFHVGKTSERCVPMTEPRK